MLFSAQRWLTQKKIVQSGCRLHSFETLFLSSVPDEDTIKSEGAIMVTTFEPRHEKTCLCYIRTTKAKISLHIRNFKPLPSFCGCAGRFVSYLVGNPEDRFSRDEPLLSCTQGQIIQSKITAWSCLQNSPHYNHREKFRPSRASNSKANSPICPKVESSEI